ncbi:MAG: DUF5385 family protein, partial [Malacoplasma sp.]|nr:DUF5385 family protein [Malacoplasma sp.]
RKALVSNRKNKDEVWKTIKQYMKDKNQYGDEIIDSYVAKRNTIDYINPNWSGIIKTQVKYANKIRDLQYRQNKQEAISTQSKNKFKRPPVRDLYVVCFTTRSNRTGKINPPQAIECEVITKRIDRRNADRKIVINGKLDYDKEMEWIAPIRTMESERNAKLVRQQEKRQEELQARARVQKEKIERKQAAKRAKELAKQEKHAK